MELKKKLRMIKQKIKEILSKYPGIYRIGHLINDLCVLPISWLIMLVHAPGVVLRSHGYDSPRYAQIKSYKDIHHGKRCFIICTGPSLRIEDVNKLKDEICFGMNGVYKLYDRTDWRPTYYAMQDVSVFRTVREDPAFSKVKKIFAPDFFYKEMCKDVECVKFPIDYYGEMHLSHILTQNIKPLHFRFSDNAYEVVHNGGTITYSVMQIAAYMGVDEIYLLGADCDYSGKKQHFVNYAGESRNPKGAETYMNSAYRAAKKYTENHKLKIYNATRGGKLEIFERVDFDSLFPENDSAG